MIIDEERIKLQQRYEPFSVMMDLVDVQEAFQDQHRQTQRAILDDLLFTLTSAQLQLFKKYMDEIFVQMLVVEESSYYEGINQTVDYINKKEP